MITNVIQRFLCGVIAPFFVLASPLFAQDRLFITEFMAANHGTILDSDGASSDWLEIYNAGTNPVNLAGWYLTDDATNLTKWSFPATNLMPGRFLLVFASGKNRAVAGQPLHTSFQLDSAGEYLALVKPDGLTVAHEYAPVFPPQIEDVSYGMVVSLAPTWFLTNGAALKWSVPLGPAGLPLDWAATNFNDMAWADGRTGLGYDTRGTNTFASGPATNVAWGKPTSQSSTNASSLPALAVNGNYNDFSHTLAGRNLPATWEVNLGTNYGIERVVLYNRPSNRSRLRDITVCVLDVTGTVTNFTSELLNPENILGGGALNSGPTNLTLDLKQLTGGLVLGGRVRIIRTPDLDRSGSGGQGSTSEADVLALAEVEVFGVPAIETFANLIETDLAGAMHHQSPAALVRLPFIIPVEEMPSLDLLTLRIQYDDGFVAYLNGAEVARRNSPVTLAWNATAPTEHPASAAFQFEEIDLTPFLGLLQEGDNVLAIHGLNLTADDEDFLILPELIGQSIRMTPNRYFAQPTPGTTNATSYLGMVAETQFSVDRGFFDTPFVVELSTATEGAEIRYTTNGMAPSAVEGLVYTGPIDVNRTTVLRAMATKLGYIPSEVNTHTYVFLSDVLTQTLAVATGHGFPSSWPGTTADYDMDPNVTGPYAAQMIPALRSLPSVFITTSISNLFDATSGIYTHPLQTGVAWERPVSLEMVGTNGLSEFQENCGLRIQGGVYFRNFSMTQKKSFRVLFKGQYGPGKLHHDLFNEPGAVQEFDGLVLRAGANDGYAWGDAGTTVQFLRDEFGRRLQLDMGHPTARGMFVHLYLNGLYWGLYNLVERPNEKFSAAYLGGEPEQWDANDGGDFKSGGTAASTRWNDFTSKTSQVTDYAGYQALQGNNTDGTRNPALPLYFDKRNYMDYMIANIWGGNWDWPHKNFWFGRLQTADSTGYKFYTWDFENTMGNNRSRSPLNMQAPRSDVASSWVGTPHYRLKTYSEYKLDFADRVQRYFFNGGLLTPETLTKRYRQLADSVQPAILAESARWGDDNLNPPQDQADWLRERDWLLETYLPQRSAVVLEQFRNAGLYPNVSAPGFSQLGGAVPDGFGLVMSHANASGTIYFTLDGSDPRLFGTGAVAPAAYVYTVPVTFSAPTIVRARVLSAAEWSALVEAVFYPPQDLGALALTEIMYHAPNMGSTDGDEFDFIELKNTGVHALDLSGLSFTAGITFTFTNGTTLAPGHFFVLVRNAVAFGAKYPEVPSNGIYTGKLDNGGETLTLSHPLGTTVFSVTYNDQAPWPETPDGLGCSLVPMYPGVTQAPDDGTKWRSSAQPDGSPGADDPPPSIPPVVINEIHYHPVVGGDEFVELLNRTTDTVLLYDPVNPTNTWKLAGLGYTFPTNLVLGPGALLLLVSTEPAEFRVKYDIPPGVQIVGPVPGILQDGGERLELQVPGTSATNPVPYVTIEEIGYDNEAPWPSGADGGGLSLQRIAASAYGNDPMNWRAADPTPGRLNETVDTDGDGLPDVWEIAYGTQWNAPDADADPDHDGMSNREEFIAGTNPNDPASCLRILWITAGSGPVTLEFLAVSNRTYSVIYQSTTNAAVWTKLADVPVQPTHHLATVTDDTPRDAARFYRLVTPAQP